MPFYNYKIGDESRQQFFMFFTGTREVISNEKINKRKCQNIGPRAKKLENPLIFYV